MFEIEKELKEFIRKEKENLRPASILNLVKDTIIEMLNFNLPKTYILNYLNKELNTNINYQTFNSFIKKINLNNSKRKIKDLSKKENDKNDFLGII